MGLTKERDGIEVATPEHDKLMAIPEERRETAQEFYDWIHSQGWEIAEYTMLSRWVEDDDEGEVREQFRSHELVPIKYRPADVMGMFLGIDPKKFADEKDAIVRALQERARGEK
jgi:hypothetical protein